MSYPLPASLQAAWDRAFEAKVAAELAAANKKRLDGEFASLTATVTHAGTEAAAKAGVLDEAKNSFQRVFEGFLVVGGSAGEEPAPMAAPSLRATPIKKAS